MTNIAERVAKGAAFLDEHDPEWWRADVERAIDLKELDLWSAHKCVLGQRCPVEAIENWYDDDQDIDEPWQAQAMELHDSNDWGQIHPWSVECGFNMESADDGEWCDLTTEWKRVITERRSAS